MQLCDRFLTTFDTPQLKAAMHRDPLLQSGSRAVTEATRLSEKIIFADSTMRMLTAKMNHFEETVAEVLAATGGKSQELLAGAAERLGAFRGGWIEFHKPIDCVKALLIFVPSVYVRTGKNGQYLYLIGEDADIIDVLYCPQIGGAWQYEPPMHTCTTCKREYGVFLPCVRCRQMLAVWGEIMALSFIIAGQYLAAQRYEEITVTSMQHQKREHGGKVRRSPVKHTYKVIDANEIIVRMPVEEPTQSEKGERGSWIDSSTIYEEIRTRPFTRTYRSARYVNMKGKTQEFPNGIKRLQPRRPELLGKSITKVKASLYEEEEQNHG